MLFKQLQWFVIKEQILISSNSQKKNDLYIKFLWKMVLPHLDLEQRTSVESNENEEIREKKAERNENLLTQFLKTALALNCFDQAYYELNNKLHDYPFIKDTLK